VPQDTAAVVQGLKRSTENTLNLAISRLDVEVPPAYQLGVEGDQKQGRLLDDKMAADNKREIARSDRELARIFVEMMQPVGDGLVVAFRTKALANAAKRTWKLDPSEATIISFPEKSKSAFAAEVSAPAEFRKTLSKVKCLCLLVVAPYLDQLRLVNDLSNTVGDAMGIMLLNARIHGRDRTTQKLPAKLKKEMMENFVPSYHIRFLERKNSILFHAMGGEGLSPWLVAQQRELFGGRPVTQEILRSKDEPTPAQVEQAFEEYDTKERSVTDTLLDLVDKDR